MLCFVGVFLDKVANNTVSVVTRDILMRSKINRETAQAEGCVSNTCWAAPHNFQTAREYKFCIQILNLALIQEINTWANIFTAVISMLLWTLITDFKPPPKTQTTKNQTHKHKNTAKLVSVLLSYSFPICSWR